MWGVLKRFAPETSQQRKRPRIEDEGETDQGEAASEPSSPFPDGVKVLHDCPDAAVDICFVHGLTGNRETTWTAPGQSAPWPETLLPPRLSKARILTYGYNAYIVRKSVASTNRLIDHAKNLLNDLATNRTCSDASSRPLILVAHSMGGLICKEAILMSRNNAEPHLRSIFDYTKGIVFMGTPHKGSWMAAWAKISASALGLAKSTNKSLLEILETKNQLLESIQDRFWNMIREQREGGRRLEITCFFEELPLSIAGLVVPKESATLDGYNSMSIHADHSAMVRFASADDNGFKRLLGELTRWASQAAPRSLDKEQKQMLFESLRFDQFNTRYENIKKEHVNTCEWLLKTPEYADWLDPSKLGKHHGFLWIKGNPGAGKSTLMKFALAKARVELRNSVIVSFFFNARGHDLEKSTIGMYRSLLLQLLELTGLKGLSIPLGFAVRDNDPKEWSVESLKALFEQAVLGPGISSLVCFIDALDECAEDLIRDMIGFFHRVGELATSAGMTFQVCFASRHYPHITITKGLELVLDEQEGHTQDIVSYLDTELKIGHDEFADAIRVDIKEKASGIFMWVFLVVRILNQEYDRGNKHMLREKLQALPEDLHTLFRDILTRDRHGRDQMLLCIQWVLFARYPLKPVQLYLAIRSGFEPQLPYPWIPGDIKDFDIRKYILSSSKGLAEITRISRNPTVQFIHESVKDFLLKEEGLKIIWSDFGKNFEGESHERLKQLCLRHMRAGIAGLNIDNSFLKGTLEEASKVRRSAHIEFPFLEYAVPNVLYHADAAEGGGVNQANFLQSFQLADWIKLDSLFEDRHTPKASLLYILAEHDMSHLINRHPDKLSCFEIESERYGVPILAAMATGSHQAVCTLLKAQADSEPLVPSLHSLYEQYCRKGNERAGIGREFKFSRELNLPSALAAAGIEIILAFVLASEKHNVDVDAADERYGRTPLSWAAGEGHEAVVRLLLRRGAVIEMADKNGRTPLSWATEKGHKAIVRLLLRRGADIMAAAKDGRTPISWAAEKGHEAVVRLLLRRGADIRMANKDGRTPLSWAAEKGHHAIVQLLLRRGADIEMANKNGRTPLSWAAEKGHRAIVRLLISKGAIIETADKDGRTPLWYAALNYRFWPQRYIVTELLDEGAVIDAVDKDGRTILSYIAATGHKRKSTIVMSDMESFVRQLLYRNANIDAADNDGRTPLSYAAANNNPRIVEMLLDWGADFDAADKEGKTPLSWAYKKRNRLIVQLLSLNN